MSNDNHSGRNDARNTFLKKGDRSPAIYVPGGQKWFQTLRRGGGQKLKPKAPKAAKSQKPYGDLRKHGCHLWLLFSRDSFLERTCTHKYIFAKLVIMFWVVSFLKRYHPKNTNCEKRMLLQGRNSVQFKFGRHPWHTLECSASALVWWRRPAIPEISGRGGT